MLILAAAAFVGQDAFLVIYNAKIGVSSASSQHEYQRPRSPLKQPDGPVTSAE